MPGFDGPNADTVQPQGSRSMVDSLAVAAQGLGDVDRWPIRQGPVKEGSGRWPEWIPGA
jgi:hypothetical protein